MIRFRKYSFLNLFNVLMLAVVTFVSFRLILIAALVTTFFLVTFDSKSVRLSVAKLVLIAGSLFLILAVLNSLEMPAIMSATTCPLVWQD